MIKQSNLNYYFGGAVIIAFCIFTVWNVTHSNGKLAKKLEDTLEKIETMRRRLSSDMPLTIGTRLEEANDNWRRGVERRKKLEQENVLDLEDPWNFIKGISIWDYFYPNFDCPHTVERVGKSGDGGKWICGFSHLAKKKDPCIVYSYGVKDDTSFEDEIVARTNCSVYLFDHSIDITQIKLPQLYPERVFIEKIGLGVNDTSDTKLRSLKSSMEKYRHDFVDILKVDVEGAEFAVFDNFKSDFPRALPFGQLSIELHLPVKIKKGMSFKKYFSWMTNLEDMGLRAFRNEVNLISIKRSPKHYSNLCEYSFINVKYDNYLLH